MSDHVLDAFARRAAEALDRRSALGVLSGAALAVLTPFAGEANKKGKGKGKGKGKKKGKKKKKEQGGVCKAGSTGCTPQRCQNAAIECRVAVQGGCEQLFTSEVDIAVCVAARRACCDLLAQCKDAEANACFDEINQGG
jgi:hypothetical protein